MSPVHLTPKYFDQQLEVVREFTYVSSTITECLSLDSELNKRIELAKQQTPYLVCQRENVTNNKPDCTHRFHGLQSLRAERPLVWQRILDSSCQS